MKKTIATLAILASASANALMPGPGAHVPERPETKTACIEVYEGYSDGSLITGTCDATMKNEMYSKQLMENGCAKGQAAMQVVENQIKSCPTYVQL